MIRARRFPFSSLTIWLLIVSLLAAQWVGIAHRIAHAGNIPLLVLSAEPGNDFADKAGTSASHSCVLFDAATVGDVFHSAVPIPPCLQGAPVVGTLAIALSWNAFPARFFLSRAPPDLHLPSLT